MYFGSYSMINSGDRTVQILPSSLTLRVSTLECNVNTPLTIDFGSVARNTQANKELALKNVPLVTTCGQASDFINANVNLQLRAISGLYGGQPTRLALNQGGGISPVKSTVASPAAGRVRRLAGYALTARR